MVVDPSDKFVYVTNLGDTSNIVAYAVNPSNPSGLSNGMARRMLPAIPLRWGRLWLCPQQAKGKPFLPAWMGRRETHRLWSQHKRLPLLRQGWMRQS